MTLDQRIEALGQLQAYIEAPDEQLEAVIEYAYLKNRWFEPRLVKHSLAAIARAFLDKEKLKAWVSNYDIKDSASAKKIGLVLAGNIPLVGFHDILSVFIAGHEACVKYSDKDAFLIPFLLKKLAEINPATKAYFTETQFLKGFEAVIATGSNNSARYFETYFSKYPHIIRKNRNAIAVLDGSESKEELYRLAGDVFQYFGLGCRNVSKVYLPKGYDFTPFMEALYEYKTIVNNSKYKNNFDYNYALLVLNRVDFKANSCIILKEDEAIVSRIAQLHYEFYEELETLSVSLDEKREEIQCIVSKLPINQFKTFAFGDAQQPSLMDYADGVDTVEFLCGLY